MGRQSPEQTGLSFQKDENIRVRDLGFPSQAVGDPSELTSRKITMTILQDREERYDTVRGGKGSDLQSDACSTPPQEAWQLLDCIRETCPNLTSIKSFIFGRR